MYKFLFLAAFFLLGCSTTSTLTLNDGQVYEGNLTRENSGIVRVDIEDGEDILVESSTIQDVDHPGNVHFAVGTTLSAFGLFGVVFSLAFALRPNSELASLGLIYLIPSVPLLVVGVPMAIWGGDTFFTAENQIANPTLSLQPTVLGKEGFSPGLNVKLQF